MYSRYDKYFMNTLERLFEKYDIEQIDVWLCPSKILIISTGIPMQVVEDSVTINNNGAIVSTEFYFEYCHCSNGDFRKAVILDMSLGARHELSNLIMGLLDESSWISLSPDNKFITVKRENLTLLRDYIRMSNVL